MSRNPQSIDEATMDACAKHTLASFIGWQVAAVDTIKDEALALALVGAAEVNIRKLMLGEALPLGQFEVSLNNVIGRELAEKLGVSLDDIANALEAKINTMEAPNAAV